MSRWHGNHGKMNEEGRREARREGGRERGKAGGPKAGVISTNTSVTRAHHLRTEAPKSLKLQNSTKNQLYDSDVGNSLRHVRKTDEIVKLGPL